VLNMVASPRKTNSFNALMNSLPVRLKPQKARSNGAHLHPRPQCPLQTDLVAACARCGPAPSWRSGPSATLQQESVHNIRQRAWLKGNCNAHILHLCLESATAQSINSCSYRLPLQRGGPLTIGDARKHNSDGQAEPRALRHLFHCTGGGAAERGGRGTLALGVDAVGCLVSAGCPQCWGSYWNAPAQHPCSLQELSQPTYHCWRRRRPSRR